MPHRITRKSDAALRVVIAAGTLLTLALPAAAARPDSRTMTCEGARSFIRQSGAVVMTTGQYTYARIVSGYGYCDRGEETELKTAPTLDNAKCRIGYICRDRIDDDKPLWFRMR